MKKDIKTWMLVNFILLCLAAMLTSCEKEPVIEKEPYWGWDGKDIHLYKLSDADFDFVLEVREINQYTVGVKVVENTLTGEIVCEEKEVGRDALVGFEPCPYCVNKCEE